ncbi:hypothetical protein ElyMa_001562100 [Elysia marginata]|uniref:Reverse transcriptase domain-containing protein n=1 Tax=Elysia marginata TaxID=1093978 RepID=A0AAV4JBE2_9GAST|nr:hypothetical protein ElyMa_001562100 [Elysia marginata]
MYLSETGLAPILQSAYHPLHSTETAPLRVHNDIIGQVDQRKAVMLVLLDLSTQFDTTDQDCLSHSLQKQFGIKGVALKWLASYMSERSQAVQINPTAVSSSTSTSVWRSPRVCTRTSSVHVLYSPSK